MTSATLPIAQRPSARTRLCPACGASGATTLHHSHLPLPDGHPLEHGLTQVECQACQMAYVNPVGTEEAYREYYCRLSKYECAATSSGSGLKLHEIERFRGLAERLAQHLPDRDARILDVGCASGGLLRALLSLGYQRPCGIDPSEVCVEIVRRELGLEAWEGVASSLPPEAGKFDAVVLSHVLEHLADPSAALEHLLARLEPGGLVYVEVPDAERYADFINAPLQDFNPEHINHFSIATLTALLARHGLGPLERGQGLTELAPGQPFPVIYCVARQGAPLVAQEPGAGDRFAGRMRAYIQASQAILVAMDRLVAPVVDAGEPLLVWGVGSLVLRLLADTSLARGRIVVFVDSNPAMQGRRMCGIPILPPAELQGMPGTILVASTIHEEAIRADIRTKWNLPNPVIGLRAALQSP